MNELHLAVSNGAVGSCSISRGALAAARDVAIVRATYRAGLENGQANCKVRNRDILEKSFPKPAVRLLTIALQDGLRSVCLA